MFKKLLCLPHRIVCKLQFFDFLAPLGFRLYLVPILWVAGVQKFQHIESTARWFGNPTWGLGLPHPMLMAYLATGAELLGAMLLLVGLATRYISIPLIIVMIVAALTVHIENGWLAIAAKHSMGAQRLSEFMTWLKSTHPARYEFITEHGKPVVLNNGIEFAATYLLMLLSLFFSGGGRFFSLDYWLTRNMKCPRHG